MGKTTNKHSREMRERAVRMALDHEGQNESWRAAILSIPSKVGCAAQTLNERVKKAEVDRGRLAGVPTEMAQTTKAPERENRGRRQVEPLSAIGSRTMAREILRRARRPILRWRSSTAGRGHGRLHRRSSQGPWGRADPARVPPIAPSTWLTITLPREPARPACRTKPGRDAEARAGTGRVFEADVRVHGARKVWRRMRREGSDVARCTVARLMRDLGLEGVIRGARRDAPPSLTRRRQARWIA